MCGKLEFLIEQKDTNISSSGFVVCYRAGMMKHCYCTSDERKSFETYEAAEKWMKQMHISDNDYFIAEHIFY